MKIILLGKMGAGKNTVADYLTDKYGFKQLAFADKLKEIARELFPDAFVTGKPRELLQVLGQKMREIQRDCWTYYVMRQVHDYQDVVITDCRYLNELEIAQKYGFIPVRVVCSDSIRIDRLMDRDGVFNPETLNHVSETELDGVIVDSILVNNGTKKDLYKKIDTLIDYLRQEDQS